MYGGVNVQLHIFWTKSAGRCELSASRSGPFTSRKRASGTHWMGTSWCLERTQFSCLAGNRTSFLIIASYLFKLHLNFFLPSTSRFPKCSLSFRCLSWVSRVRSMCPSRFDHANNICREVKTTDLCSFLNLSLTSSLSDPTILLRALFSGSRHL